VDDFSSHASVGESLPGADDASSHVLIRKALMIDLSTQTCRFLYSWLAVFSETPPVRCCAMRFPTQVASSIDRRITSGWDARKPAAAYSSQKKGRVHPTFRRRVDGKKELK